MTCAPFCSLCFAVTAEIAVVKPHVPHMTQFIEHVGADDDVSDGVIAACCGLIG